MFDSATGAPLRNHALREQYQAAMALPVLATHEAKLRNALHSLLFCALQSPDDLVAQQMLRAARLRLRQLQNHLLCQATSASFAPRCYDLRQLLATLCQAADHLLQPLGRLVRFVAPQRPCPADVSLRIFSLLFLELIANSVRYDLGDSIVVQLQCHAPVCYVLRVQCEGTLVLAKWHAALQRPNSGVAALCRAAALHHAPLFWAQQSHTVAAQLRLPQRHVLPRQLQTTPGLLDLLCDPCSLLYSALAQVTL